MPKDIAIPDLIEKYWESVPSAWHRTRSIIRGIASERFGLTVEQFQVLRRIRRGIASVSALADDNRTSRSSVSKAVDSLVHKGLISRNLDPNDRRNIPLTLTQEGQRTMETIYRETEKWLDERLRRLDAAELKSLYGAMDLLKMAFGDE